MKRIGLSLGCLLAAAGVLAADPVASARSEAESAAAVASASAASTPAAPAPVTRDAAKPRLDLRIGDIREYMPADEFRALSADREPERNTVIVEGRAALLAVKEDSPVPNAIMAPFWALMNPTQAWRIFVPDLKRPPDGPPDSKIPPPVFRWGP